MAAHESILNFVAPAKRRSWRFSLRNLFIAMALCAPAILICAALDVQFYVAIGATIGIAVVVLGSVWVFSFLPLPALLLALAICATVWVASVMLALSTGQPVLWTAVASFSGLQGLCLGMAAALSYSRQAR